VTLLLSLLLVLAAHVPFCSLAKIGLEQIFDVSNTAREECGLQARHAQRSGNVLTGASGGKHSEKSGEEPGKGGCASWPDSWEDIGYWQGHPGIDH
jgi:hypothetical protein